MIKRYKRDKRLKKRINTGRFRTSGFGECVVSVFVSGEDAKVPSFRFSFRGNMRTYPRSGFRSGGTSAKTTLWENHPFVNPRKRLAKYFFSGPKRPPRTKQGKCAKSADCSFIVTGFSLWVTPRFENFAIWRALGSGSPMEIQAVLESAGTTLEEENLDHHAVFSVLIFTVGVKCGENRGRPN